MSPKKNCHSSCQLVKAPVQIPLVVLTGGPGAGKTAILEFIKKDLCENIAIFPEAASILFGGGFWRLDSLSARKSAQRSIYYIQNEMQNLVINENKWILGLCDRGTLDGLAYWPTTPQEFFEELETTYEQEYAKYHAVIHLSTPSLQNGYNYQNPIRIESAEEAKVIDEKIHQIWKGHPQYYRIDSSRSFLEKIQKASQLIHSFLPTNCQSAK